MFGVHWWVPKAYIWSGGHLVEVPGRSAKSWPIGKSLAGRRWRPRRWSSRRHNFSVRTPNWVIQMSILIILESTLTWCYQIGHLKMFIMMSYYVHVSPCLHMLHFVLILAYCEHRPAGDLKPQKLVELGYGKWFSHDYDHMSMKSRKCWW
jgi:hypothetical protein